MYTSTLQIFENDGVNVLFCTTVHFHSRRHPDHHWQTGKDTHKKEGKD
jgi:hypothetical protein